MDPATGQTVPNAYRSKVSTAIYEATRSLGWNVKHDITFGAMVYAAAYHAVLPEASAQTTADYSAAYVPADNSRAGPFVQYRSYTKRYVRLVDFETLAFQEDAFLGHDVVLRASPSFHELGATFEGVGTYAAAQYSFALGDGYFRALLATTTDLEPDRIRNAAFSPAVRLVTPTLAGLGRLVFDGIALNRWRNELNIKGACQGLSTYAPFAQCSTYLGGSNRLRGYPTNFFPGKDFAAYNVELRTRPPEGSHDPCRSHRVLRLRSRFRRLRPPSMVPLRRARTPGGDPLARPQHLQRRHGLSAGAAHRPDDRNSDTRVRFPNRSGAGLRYPVRRASDRPSHRTVGVVKGFRRERNSAPSPNGGGIAKEIPSGGPRGSEVRPLLGAHAQIRSSRSGVRLAPRGSLRRLGGDSRKRSRVDPGWRGERARGRRRELRVRRRVFGVLSELVLRWSREPPKWLLGRGVGGRVGRRIGG